MSVVISQACFDEGKAARAAGKAFTDDPYRAGSQESADWLAGFTDGDPETGMTGTDGDGSGYSAETAPSAKPVP